jgi:hypothetical protein
VKEGEYGEYYVFMYENGTTRPIETVLRRGGGRIKAKDGDGESKIYYKHLCKCPSEPPVQL